MFAHTVYLIILLPWLNIKLLLVGRVCESLNWKAYRNLRSADWSLRRKCIAKVINFVLLLTKHPKKTCYFYPNEYCLQKT